MAGKVLSVARRNAQPLKLPKTMNYFTSQILNFENCNVSIPVSLVREACVEIISESWMNDIDLAEAFASGTLDLKAEVASINESLAEAGCETRADEDDLKKGLSNWIETESLRGNI